MPASLIGLWFYDLRVRGVACVRILFFVAPGLVALDQVHGSARDLLPLNPLTGLFESYREHIPLRALPVRVGAPLPLAAAAVLLVTLLPLYRREQRHFAKVV